MLALVMERQSRREGLRRQVGLEIALPFFDFSFGMFWARRR